jgi:hypothetical protein
MLQPNPGSRDVSATGTGKVNTSEQNLSGIGGGSIFTIDNITFGLEVCLDHYKRRLADYTPQKGEPLPQIQLIPSEGANIVKNSIAVEAGGIIFNVDGAYGSQGKANKPTYLLDTWRRSTVIKYSGASQQNPVDEVSSVKNSLVGTNWFTTSHGTYMNHHGYLRAYKAVDIGPSRVA